MAGILAIEADSTRQHLLQTLVAEHVAADLTIVDSVDAAIAQIARQVPDLILAPTLLSPRDSENLIAHVKRQAPAHVQVVTLSALDMLVAPPATAEPRLRIFRRRRPVSLGLQYDPAMVGIQIRDGLERARTLRQELEAAAANATRAPEVGLTRRVPGSPELASVPQGKGSHREDRRIAHRTPQRGAPWLSSIRLPWGVHVDLVNISRTGLLLESGSKVTPGVSLDLHLSGPGLNRIVNARFIRSEVARVDRLGVRYHAAAQFDAPLDFLAPREEAAPRATPHQLAELLTTVLDPSGNRAEPPVIKFARGLRTLIGARDVLVRATPIAPVDDSESIYFHVAGAGPSRTILQVMFERDRALTAGEFKLLKAAAALTAAVLEVQGPRAAAPAPGTPRMSEVA
jgi:CheY-like chemotaxis protein